MSRKTIENELVARPGYVILKKIGENMSPGGIAIPDNVAKEGWEITKGEVIAAVKEDGLETGDVVLYGPGKSSRFQYKGLGLVMCKSDGILAVVCD